MDEEPTEGDQVEDPAVFAPSELDIASDEHVRVLGDNRYVISADTPIGSQRGDDRQTDDGSGSPDETPSLDPQTVYDWLAERLSSADASYGFDVTARFDDRVSHYRLRGADVVTVFDALMYWYGAQLDDETPIEEVLGILLTESNVTVTYPADTVHELVRAHGLEYDDSIGDLLEAVGGDGRVRFPPE